MAALIDFLVAPWRLIVRHWTILATTAKIELRITYAGSVLGLAWVVVAPLLLLAIYSLTYAIIFQVRVPGLTTVDYVIHVSAGLIAFLAFAGALAAGSISVVRNKQILASTVFPPELLPVRAVIVTLPPLAVGGAVIAIGALLYGASGWAIMALPVVMLLQFMFTCGVVWVLALVTLVLRDVQHLIQYLVIILLIITPIGYVLDMVPGRLALLTYLNPLAYFVLSYQEILVHGSLPGLWLTLGMVAASVISFCGGYWVFERAKRAFYDYA
jgi:lipopolysaccharide transport system permease protein